MIRVLCVTFNYKKKVTVISVLIRRGKIFYHEPHEKEKIKKKLAQRRAVLRTA